MYAHNVATMHAIYTNFRIHYTSLLLVFLLSQKDFNCHFYNIYFTHLPVLFKNAYFYQNKLMVH